MRHLPRVVRLRVRRPRQRRYLAYGTGIRSGDGCRGAPTRVSPGCRRPSPAPSNARPGREGASRIDPQAISYSGGTEGGHLRRTHRVLGTAGLDSRRAVRRGAMFRRDAGRSRPGEHGPVRPACPIGKTVCRGRGCHPGGAPGASGTRKRRTTHERRRSPVRQETPEVPGLVGDSLHALPRHRSRKADPVLSDLPRDSIPTDRRRRGFRSRKNRPGHRHAGGEQPRAPNLRDSARSRAGSRRQRRSPP